ncbi:Cytochrome c oxidase assembly protein COX19, partial [Geodia barretti]
YARHHAHRFTESSKAKASRQRQFSSGPRWYAGRAVMLLLNHSRPIIGLSLGTGECRDHMMKFLSCLKEKGSDNSLCRDESRAYLQCRMDRDLMTKEDFRKLGYKEPDEINLR